MLVKGSLPPGLVGHEDLTRSIISESVRRHLLFSSPRDDDELEAYFGAVHGFWLARKPCCPEHSSPFEFLSDAYFQRYLRILAMAAKGTGKTQLLALLHVANSRFKPGCWTAHMGAHQAQSDRCYDYFLREISRPEILPEIAGKPLKSETLWKSKDNDITPGSRVEVLTATIAQASGPHEQIGTGDEFDQFGWDVWEHFNKTMHEAHGIKAQTILASTRFLKYGPVNRVIETLGTNLKVYPWCVWDVMAPCPYPCKKLPSACGAFAGKQCPLYERHSVDADGQKTVTPLCAGKAHKATGHLSWDEVINQFLLSSEGSFATLQTLDEPGREGLFFQELDNLRHRSDKLYKYVPGRDVYLGYDYGYGHPLCLGAWQVRPEDGLFYQFDELYGSHILTRNVCEWLSTREWLKDVQVGWPDPSNPEAIEEFRIFFHKMLGRYVMRTNTDNERIPGWGAVRRRLKGPLGGILIGLDRTKCPQTWNDLAGLQCKEGTEDCEKKQDHGADQVRYLVRNLEKYLRAQDAWSEDNRPDGVHETSRGEANTDDSARKLKENQTEELIKQRSDMLTRAGIPPKRITEHEARYSNDRAAFADALGEWLSEYTLQGRMNRAGMRPSSDDDDDE